MTFKFSELCDKEVINCSTASCIGVVNDVLINCEGGRVEAILVEDSKIFSLKKPDQICIPWEKIDKIGEDFIIVSGAFQIPMPLEEKSGRRKLFFSK